MYFDRAVWVFASRVEEELEKAGQDKTKSDSPQRKLMRRNMVLHKWLGAGSFADRR